MILGMDAYSGAKLRIDLRRSGGVKGKLASVLIIGNSQSTFRQ